MVFKRGAVIVAGTLIAAVGLAIGLSGRTPPPVTTFPKSGRLLITGATVIDPRDGSESKSSSIEMDSGRIVRVFRDGTVDIGRSIRRIDAAGKFIVPGLNDMHSHVLDAEDLPRALSLMLADGVTGFRQMSGSEQQLKYRSEGRLPLGILAPALLQMPGSVLTPFNAGSVEDMRKEVRRQVAEGADFIKVALVSPEVFYAAIQEANAAKIPILGHLQYGVDPARAARDGFHSIEHLGPGMPIWIACSTDNAVLNAEAAANPPMKAPPKIPFLESIVMSRIKERLINPAAFANPQDAVTLTKAFDTYSAQRCGALAKLFVDLGTWHVPTLIRLKTQEMVDDPKFQRDGSLQYMTKADFEAWQRVTAKYAALPPSIRNVYHRAYANQMKLAKLFSDAGVRMMVGTDGGTWQNVSQDIQDEFDELASAGISPLKILQMSTVDPALYLGRTGQMGRVAEGYDADLVILDGDPLESVANYRRIAGVVRGGFYHSAKELNQIRKQARDAVR